MPVDDNIDASYNFYGDTLYELSSLVSLYDDCDFIIGGDFNVDFSRKNSRNLGLFKVFINDEDFICPSLHHLKDNYTREDNLGNRSFIDHFLVSKNVINSNFSVAYDGCNLSDHNPISINTMYNNKSTYSSNNCSYKILDWGKASDANIHSYKMLLNHYLYNFNIPKSILNCNNFSCTLHDNIILQCLDDLLNIMIISGKDSIPTKKVNSKTKGMPGWNSHVKPYKDKSMFWNDIWKQAGKPVSGHIAEERRFARARYHWSIKQIKKHKDSIILTKTAQQLETKSYTLFWSTIKKINGNSKTVVNVMDEVSTDKEIVDIFYNKYNNLYSSVKDENLPNTVKNVNSLVNVKCNRNMCSESSCHVISNDRIKNAISKLKSGKDDETYEMYSDHFINSTKLFQDFLSQIITIMLKHGTTSNIINKSNIKPIHKC